MSNNGNTKKRRVEDVTRVSIDGSGISGGDNGSELSAIKSMMQELVQQNRTQTNMINSMQAEITHLRQNRLQTDIQIATLRQHTDTMKGMSDNISGMVQIMTSMNGEMKNTRKEITQLREKCVNMGGVQQDLKYHEILLQNQQWKYSADQPSNEYWNSLDANGRVNARKFLAEIKKCTEEMRYGTTGDNMSRISIDADLPYNTEFLPHWKEFANALNRYYLERAEGGSQSVLLLWHMELPDEVIDLLSKALQSTFFNRIALVGNSFGEKGVNFALNYLENNQS